MKINAKILKNILNCDINFEFESNGISIDSRNINNNDLFIGVKGLKSDGNIFAKDAIKNGAAAAIIDNPEINSEKCIFVQNSIEALKAIGLYAKNTANLKSTIGITGSVGKTTTRSWINEILNKKFKSFSSIKNYNTIYGLPISLSMLEKNTDFGIFEMGTNSFGEIQELSEYLQPDIGMITNIYESHVGMFKDTSELAKEKISIISGIKNGGTLIYDADSKFKQSIESEASLKNLKLISVGFSENCDFQILSHDKKIILKTPDGIIDYKISASGKHFAYISGCVAACIYSLELSIEDFLKDFENLSPVKGRGSTISLKYNDKNFTVIDDSYNASPSAVIASLDVLSFANDPHKIAVIGQMKELGDQENYYHDLVAKKLNSCNFDKIFFIGDEKLWKIMQIDKKIDCFSKIDNFVIEKISEIIQNDSIVLLKGSRSIGLDRFIDYIKCSTI